MIDILIPVLGRPAKAGPLVQNIHDNTSEAHTIMFICSRGDTAQFDACVESGADRILLREHPAGRGDYAHKINLGFHHSIGEWVFMAADDIQFTPGWDTRALAVAGDRFSVVATNDMANGNVRRGQFGTHNLVRRRYVTGDVLHEGYDHNFVDRELCGFAQQAGVFAFARSSVVRHHHPLFSRRVAQDATYKKSLAKFHQDRALFLSRAHLWGYHGLSAQERKLAA